MQSLHPFRGSIQEYLQELSDPNRYRPDHCPLCHGLDPLRAHGFYYRTLVDVNYDGAIRVRRYLCLLCKRTVSLLPEFALPYLRFSMNDKEIDEMAKLGKQKKAYDDSLRDLDDVYFEVQQREEQRRKQGLPSLIGVLRGYQPPGSAREEADGEPEVTRSSHVVQSRRRIKSTSRTLHQNDSSPKTRPKRRPGRTS